MDIGSLFLGGLVAGSFTSGTHLFTELSTLVIVVLVVFRDQFLSSHLGLVLYACFGFLFTCHLLILSRTAVLRPKASAGGKSPKQLRDTDLEFESRVEFSCRRICIREFFKNAYEFCKFRPVYGIFAIMGCVFLVVFCVLRTLVVEDQNLKVDLHSASLGFVVLGLILIFIPVIIANVGIYDFDDETDLYSYRPFQEVVKVPYRVVAGKTLAGFLTGTCTSIFIALFLLGFILLAFCSLVFVYRMTEADFDIIRTEYGVRVILFKNLRMLLVILLASTAVVGIALLSNRFVSSWHEARRSVLGVIEKNWRRNLRAIEYLLQDVEVTSLEDLKAALDAKRIEQLTDEEKRAFNYVDWPLWQTKRPFVERIIVAEQVVEPGNEIVEQPEQQRIIEPALPEDQRPVADDQAPVAEPKNQEALVKVPSEQTVEPQSKNRERGGGPLRVTQQRKTTRRRNSSEYQDYFEEDAEGVRTLSPILERLEQGQQAGTSKSVYQTPAPVDDESKEETQPRRSKRLSMVSAPLN